MKDIPQFDLEIFSSKQNVLRHVIFHIPRPIPAEFLICIGNRFKNKFSPFPGQLHFVAIANTGIPLATIFLAVASLEGSKCWLSIVDPLDSSSKPVTNLPDSVTFLVDNSVYSGKTLNVVLNRLSIHKVQIEGLIKLVDYQDKLEHRLSFEVEQNHNFKLYSLYDYDELSQDNSNLEEFKILSQKNQEAEEWT